MTLHRGWALQVCFEVVGYLLEELRDAKNFESLKQDVASANIFIGSLIFIEELAEKASSVRSVRSHQPRTLRNAAQHLAQDRPWPQQRTNDVKLRRRALMPYLADGLPLRRSWRR